MNPSFCEKSFKEEVNIEDEELENDGIELENVKFDYENEKCIQCEESPCIKGTFLCKKCYQNEHWFFETRFELINKNKMLKEENLKKFNELSYYKKRLIVQEAVFNGKMI